MRARTSCITCVNGKRNASVLEPGREVADRVDDRRRVEQQLETELPHLAHVPERDEERREDERQYRG